MPQPMTNTVSVDLSRIDNAEVRRAMRQLVQQLQETILHQQVQIEALVELITEKNVASLSEYRRAVQQMTAHATERSGRIHSQLAQPAATSNLQANPREMVEERDDDTSRRVYRL